MTMQTPFKWRHFQADIILLCVRWYLRYALGYRDLEEMMAECGVVLQGIEGRQNEEEGVLVVAFRLRLQRAWRSMQPALAHHLLPSHVLAPFVSCSSSQNLAGFAM